MMGAPIAIPIGQIIEVEFIRFILAAHHHVKPKRHVVNMTNTLNTELWAVCAGSSG